MWFSRLSSLTLVRSIAYYVQPKAAIMVHGLQSAGIYLITTLKDPLFDH